MIHILYFTLNYIFWGSRGMFVGGLTITVSLLCDHKIEMEGAVELSRDLECSNSGFFLNCYYY